MTCYSPLDAWRIAGDTKLRFNYPHRADILEQLKIPCGQCIGCRLERSRQWAIRCIHEAQLHEQNCFITLTFANEHLPNPPSLNVRDFQLFMKRLRKRFGKGVRFFHCGEYGENFGRPHYHACLFNFDFPDKEIWRVSNGFRIYTSKILEELWPFGFSTIGDVTFESAAYVARYVLKKVTGHAQESHYESYDPSTGEVFNLRPEYVTMSRRPGLASGWFDKFCSDVYPSDIVVVRGKKMRPPRFYDNRFKAAFPIEFEEIQFQRFLDAQKHVDNCSKERLDVRRQVQEARAAKLIRPLEA